MEITLDLVWNGKVDKNNRLMSKEELEKALNTEVNKEKIRNNKFLVEEDINIDPIDLSYLDCNEERVIGFVKSFDLDNSKVTINIKTCDDELTLDGYQIAFKKLAHVKLENNVSILSDVNIISCYLIGKDISARID